MLSLTNTAKGYLVIVGLMGLAVSIFALLNWRSQNTMRYACYVMVAMLASTLKVSLPGVTGTMSVTYLFVLIGIVQLSFQETLLMLCAATLIQCFWHAKPRPKPVQVIFNVANMANAVAASYLVYHYPLSAKMNFSPPVLLALAACTFFLLNTIPVAAVISLTEGKSIKKTWKECYFWSFPYYLVGAAVVGMVTLPIRFTGSEASMLALPVVYVIYRSYGLYLGRLEAERKHVEEMAGLHLRTIGALALAIDAKDNTTHDHLQRVQVYALAIGGEIGISEPEMEALRAAALLHDIGKLAVPEHIISKPGKLTPEEFEKMRIHPIVGAEILERVHFPCPVVPIVRSHHEKWNGTGYPDGLKGEDIPIGARILAAVDCLDALASDRQYRRALPLHEAMEKVCSESGKSFDPKVVEILKSGYVELEQRAHQIPFERSKLSTDVKIERGAEPAAGFEAADVSRLEGDGDSVGFLCSIAAARQEFHMLFELAHDLGNSLSLDETLSVLAVRLKRMIPYDSIAIYVRREDNLVPAYVNGENFRLFSSLEIPWGQGLSGWVAENQKPIVNGNPSVEPGYLNDPTKFSTLRSALAVPLEGPNGVVGVLALYASEKDAFIKDHLRVLLGISSKLALAVENALKYRQAQSSAVTDDLTGLPNTRSLFLHLDSELARCKRMDVPLAVLVCDLDGFKQVNDRFGHLEGNKVLRAVARGLKEGCREYDYVARMGGDEFVFVLPGFKQESLPAKIAALCEVAAEAGQQVCGEELLSLSVGEAYFPNDGSDTEQLLAEADRRMYKAKQQQKIPRPLPEPFGLRLQPRLPGQGRQRSAVPA